MIDELKQELLIQYLLNEVDSSTAEKIRVELETDGELRDFLRQTEDAFVSMAYAAPPMEPPAGLSQRILRLERNAPGASSAPRSKIVWWIPWALAACLAIACLVLGLERTRLKLR